MVMLADSRLIIYLFIYGAVIANPPACFRRIGSQIGCHFRRHYWVHCSDLYGDLQIGFAAGECVYGYIGEDHMKISDKLTDYGLIGGLFWSFQVLLFWPIHWSAGDWASHLARVSPIANVIPSAATSSLSALLGILGLITIFTTGLILDNFGSFFSRGLESGAFQNEAIANKEWMQKLIEQHKAYVQNDWNVVLEQTKNFRKRWKAREAYMRLQSFLLAYASFPGKTDEITQLGLKISDWSISRSINAALVTIVVEAGFYGVFTVLSSNRTIYFILLFVIALFAISLLTTKVAHTRVCKALFAIVYISTVSACSTASMAQPGGSEA
jgi:hypothetical protein